VQVTVQDLGGCKVHIDIVVDQERVNKAFAKVYRELAQAGINGFRPGKAPPRIIRLRHGKEKIEAFATADLIPEVLEEAIKQENLHPIEQFQIGPIPDEADTAEQDPAEAAATDDDPVAAREAPAADNSAEQVELRAEENQPFSFRATGTIQPEPELCEYRGLPLRAPQVEPTDEQIDAYLQEVAEKAAEWEETDREEIRKGDCVETDLEIRPEGSEQPLHQRGERFFVGSGDHQPPLDEALIGARCGTEITIETQYPEEHSDPALAGKKATVTLKPQGIEELRIPEIDDDLAQQLGAADLNELRARATAEVRRRNERIRRSGLEQQALERLFEGSEVQIADQLITVGAEEQARVLDEQLKAQGLSLDRVLKDVDTSADEFLGNQAKRMEQSLKVHLILEAIARREDLEVQEEDIAKELTRMAAEAETDAAALRAEIEENDPGLREFRDRLRRQKVLNFVVEQAQITELPMELYLKEQRLEAQPLGTDD